MPILLDDYQPPAWRVRDIELAFDLGIDATEVDATLHVTRGGNSAQSLRLLGERMTLLDVCLDGRHLSALEYRLDEASLTIPGARDGSVVRTRVRLDPAANTALEGLYVSGPKATGFLLTQCEAEGFRRITYFLDRPDVLARYTVTLRADRARFPVLLAGGNPDGHGELAGGRHWARFVDPHPRPSYLFALVAGKLACIERAFTTAAGRAVTIKLWAEPETIERCHFALDALLQAMRWDEQVYGRCYDLDVFHVVATDDFNMGAMENKGLNIFNSKYLLADVASSTDRDYHLVEAVIGHEYFHNWSGNRVTCRDWFQLSLKEGLTVFREQSFAAAMSSPALQRIDDVRRLMQAQFPEDAGPLAHPVRPESYQEIDNFYTATVYEKGAELVRMLAGRLGPEAFRRGTDLYFSRHDGSGATIEDFLAALGDANDTDMGAYLAWYEQAGTPHVRARGHYDADAGTYTLELSQSTSPTPDQKQKHALPIPLALALFAKDGGMLPLHLADGSVAGATDCVIDLVEAEQRWTFTQVHRHPVLSLLRGFSAPVILDSNTDNHGFGVLLCHETDGFNRWFAGRQLAHRAFSACLNPDPDHGNPPLECWCAALRNLCKRVELDDCALLAELLVAPNELELGRGLQALDPDRVHATRVSLMHALASALGASLLDQHYRDLHAHECGELTAPARGRRALKNRLLHLLCDIDHEHGVALATAQFDHAASMTDKIAALTALLHFDADSAPSRVTAYRQHHDGNVMALDKWFAAQATVPDPATVERVETLLADPAFSLHNPNRVHALLGSFMRGNPVGFHRANGAGYALAADKVVQIDALNPQLAARLATAFDGWQRLEPVRRDHLRRVLQAMTARDGNSTALNEILGRILSAD